MIPDDTNACGKIGVFSWSASVCAKNLLNDYLIFIHRFFNTNACLSSVFAALL